MKKFLSVITAAIMLMTTLTGCDEGNLNGPGGMVMGDMAIQSQITAANSTASTIKNAVTTWCANLDTVRGKIPRDTVVITIEGHIKDGKWVGSVSAPGFETPDGGNVEAVEMLKDKLADHFNFSSDIAAVLWVSDRAVKGCAYSESGVSASELKQMFSIDDFESRNYKWNGKEAGVTREGKVIGTAPMLKMGN